MSLRKKSTEIKRLIDAFESESKKFHDITFSTYTITQSTNSNIKFKKPNHAINLWQYYGKIQEEHTSEDFIENFKESDPKWGIRGAQKSAFGLIEGATCDLFLKMARRASHLFSKKEADIIVYNDKEHLSPYIVVECKKEEISELEFKTAVNQAFSYAVTEGAKFVWTTSGIKDECYQVPKKKPKDRITIVDIPPYYFVPRLEKALITYGH